MGINGANFNPFNMMDYTNTSNYSYGTGTDFNMFNPMESVCTSNKTVTSIGDSFTPEVQSQIDDIVHLTNKIETELNKRYPKGFNLVGIGRSPSFIIELMKEKGYNAQTCALSGLMNGEFDISGKYSFLRQLDPNDVKAYGDYLAEMGISAEKIKTSTKPFVFIDYTRTGESLRAFQELLARKEINIKENISFLSLNQDLLPNKTIQEKNIINELWENLGIKKFTFAPRVEISELGQVDRIVKSFKPAENVMKIFQQAVKVMKHIR